MDTSHLYMFVDYDGVVKTFAENLPGRFNRQKMPFSHSMIRVLSCIAWQARLPAYFIPITSSPGDYTPAELKRMFLEVYGVDNLDLHPDIPIVPVRKDRHIYVQNILAKYRPRYHLVLDDETFWYENQNLNYFRTDTYNGITHDVFSQIGDFGGCRLDCPICNW